MSGNRRKSSIQKDAAPTPLPGAERIVATPAAQVKSERIGDILRHARLERNDDLYLIAEYLCIKPAFLIALENSRYDEFPADAYVIGFLRTYANFLGVDGKDAIDRYRYEMAGRRKKPVLSMPIPLTEGRAPSGIIMVGATVAVLLIYALWYGISSANRTSVNVPPPLPSAQQMAPSAPSDSSAAGLTAPVTAATPAPQVGAPAPSAAASTPLPPVAASAPKTPPAPVVAPPSPTVTSTSTASSAIIPPASPGIVLTAPGEPATSTTTGILSKQEPKAAAPEKDAKRSPDKIVADKAPTDKGAVDQPADQDSKKQVYGDASEVAHIIIRATQSSWVMVSDSSGKTVFDHVLKPGDIYKVPNKSGLSLTTGNGNGLVLSLDGADLPKVATGAPHVVRNIPLDSAHLTTEPSAQ
jgi:cytoskeletal protein RodZ